MPTARHTPEQLAQWVARGLISAEDAEALGKLARPSKYRNQRTEVDGRRFDSKREAKRYETLAAMQRGGFITGLECQVSFDLIVNGVRVCRYVADFVYQRDGARVVEDAKGFRTAEYKLKRKLMKAVHGIEVQEV